MGDVRHEPSMEEILSSIKRIIAEDSDAVLSAARQRRPMRSPEPETFDDDEPEDVLELTAPEAPEPPAPPRAIDLGPRHSPTPTRAPAPAPQPEPVAAVPPPAPAPVPEVASESLLSTDVADATRQALASLSTLIVKPATNADNTLEGLVREMLRPMLKEWLDAHLPALVEGLVAREIARLTGRSL